jgi:hypothetical protein
MIDLTAIIILGLIIGALLVDKYFAAKQIAQEREKFINALIARNAVDLQNLEITASIPKQDKPVMMPDLVPVQELDDDQFAKMIGDIQPEEVS